MVRPPHPRAPREKAATGGVEVLSRSPTRTTPSFCTFLLRKIVDSRSARLRLVSLLIPPQGDDRPHDDAALRHPLPPRATYRLMRPLRHQRDKTVGFDVAGTDSTDAAWSEVAPDDESAYRFFRVSVEMP